MAFLTTRRRGALALVGLAAVASLAACGEDDPDVTSPPNLENELFRRYVAMGNSITAGYQSGGLNDSLQTRSYARLLAIDVFKTSYQVNLLRKPGCPAPTTSFGGARLGGNTAPACSLTTTQAPSFVNNVAVPGALVLDATNNNTLASNTLTVLLSGGQSQITRMLRADPTFLSVWLGNNDVLGGATLGLPNPTPASGAVPASPGVTPVNTFTTRYQTMVDSIKLAGSLRGGVLIGVVDVTNIPYFFTGASLDNATNRAMLNAAAGRTVTILPNCTGNTNALIGLQIISLLRANAAVPISCAKIPNTTPGGTGTDPVVGELFILDADERTAVQAAVTGYNAFIQQKADELGFAYLNPNDLLAAERTAGRVPAFPNFTTPAGAIFGVNFSFDAVHPSTRAHRALANAITRAVSTEYSIALDTIAVP